MSYKNSSMSTGQLSLELMEKNNIHSLQDFIETVNQRKENINLASVLFDNSASLIADKTIQAKLDSSAKVGRYLMTKYGNLKNEELHVLCFNNGLNLIKDEMVSKGSLDRAVVDMRDILSVPIKCGAVSGIMLVHNHPSGNIQPSQADFKASERVKKACQLFNFNFLDNFIVTRFKYFSFSENMLFDE